MLRDFKFLRRNSGTNSNAEEVENLPVNPKNAGNPQISTDPSRPPLNSIQDPSQISKGFSDQELGMKANKVDRTPTKPKPKYSDTSTPLRTPEKQGLTSKNRFGWAQKGEQQQSSSSIVESKEDGRIAANITTPRSSKMVGRANSSYSECNSTQSTPTKSVSKPLNSGLYPASGSRPPISGGVRNFAALSKGIPSSFSSYTLVNTVDVPYFELKEDPSFWMEHNVQVLIRIRPLNSMEKSSFGFSRCLKQESAQCITWIGQPETRFTFDHVACEAIDQETLFRMVGLPMVENCLSGYNSCMFAYGQTGSGKTHTMLGEIEELEFKPSPNRGMTPRIFEFLFARIRAEEESRRDERLKYNCKCSFLEIYNEQITDLLDPSSTNLMLREDVKKGVYVENLSEFEVHTVGDIIRLLSEGSSNRKVAATNMNRESSRSHSVFTCVIESRWEKDSTTNFRFARLNLVDLAGSERQKSSGAEGERLKEAANINKSLSTLGHVIMVLVEVANGRVKHIPYRDSRLTFLLQDSLGGNSKTTIIANISPSIGSAAETLNTLKFAQRAKLIQNNAIVNEDSSGDVIALRQQIQLLKEELFRVRQEKVMRSLSFGPVIDKDTRDKDEELSNFMPGKESSGVLRVSCKQLKSLESTLAGALRREKMAETSIKQLEAEIEQLNRLVSQREEDARCSKMMLKFREDKIQRTESLLGGLISGDDYLLKENAALSEEIQLLREKFGKNPEVTRFALENIRLLEQVRKFQDFYEEGEREMLMAEIAELRNQLVLVLDEKHPNHLEAKVSAHSSNENDIIHKELKRTLSELEECRMKLSSCLEDNAKLRRELQDLRGSLNAMTSAPEEHDCSAEVIKESIVEVPLCDKPSTVTSEKYKNETASDNPMKHTEDIVDLQLELDILKIMIQEESSFRAEAEKKAQSASRELQLSNEKATSAISEYQKVQDELEKAKLVIEALESQQILSINEIEDLKISNIRFEELAKEKEFEISSLKKQAHGEFRNLSLYNQSENADSRLEMKLKKMHASLEMAKRLNLSYKKDQALQEANDEETEEVCRQVEAETAEVIVCLQEELSVLQQEVQESKMKEMETREALGLVQTEMKALEDKLNLRTEDNAELSKMLEEKEKELRTLSGEWEVMACEIETILSGGQEALEDASDHINAISTTIPCKRSWISEQCGRMKKFIVEKELLTEKLKRCLEDVTYKRNDLECKLRSLRGAALVMTETHQQECSEKDREILLLRSELRYKSSKTIELEGLIKCGKGQLRMASSCATAALLIVNRLSELNLNNQAALNDKNVQLREFQEVIFEKDAIIQNQASIIDEADKKNHSLQIELVASEENCMKLKEQLFQDQRIVEALQIMLEKSEESEILEAREKLKELNSGVMNLKSSMNEYEKQSGRKSWAGEGKKQDITNVDSRNLGGEITESSNCYFDAGTGQECLDNDILASQSIRERVKSRDATISLLKKEIESALGSLEEVQAEIAKLRNEKEEIMVSDECDRRGIESLMNQTVDLHDVIGSFGSQFELKVSSLEHKLEKMEKNLQVSCSSWFKQKELLEAELDDAKVAAAQKAIEASIVFEKFEEVQDTMKEADIMINELVIANEGLKLSSHEWEVKESNLTDDRDNLANEVQSLKLLNAQKDQQYKELEKEYGTDSVVMKRMLLELEALVSQVQTCTMDEWKSLASDFLIVKSQVHESGRLIGSMLEEVWSDIIVKDCALSVLHLCHMGILLETANGLNAENGLLQHGLSESNSIISELQEHNIRSRRELELCRDLKGKLLADIKKSFDRISGKVDENGELPLKLISFEKKIQDLQFQEETMLQRSNAMGSELAKLLQELDFNSKQALESIVDQENQLKDKDEQLEYQEEYFFLELAAKDLEMLVLSSEFKQMCLVKADVDKTCICLEEVLENLKKDVILKSSDASYSELILLDKEIECGLLQKEVEKVRGEYRELLSAFDDRSSQICQMETVNKALEQDVQSLKELVHSNDCFKGSVDEIVEEKRMLSCQVQNLESQYLQMIEDYKMEKIFVESSSSHIFELRQEMLKLQNYICLLKTESRKLSLDMEKKDEDLGRMQCIENANEILQNQLDKQKADYFVLVKELDEKTAEFDSYRKHSDVLDVENHRLRDSISVLESVVKDDLSLRIQDLQMQVDNANALKEENVSLRNELEAHKINEAEYFNALSLKNSKIVDLAKNVDTISCKIHGLITEKFVEIDYMFQKTVKQVEETHQILEQFSSLENLVVQLDSDIISVEMELSRKDEVLKGLLFDLSLLQESASNSMDQKDEMEELMAHIKALERDLEKKTSELDKAVADGQILEDQLEEKRVIISSLESDIAKASDKIESLSCKNDELLASAAEALEAKKSMEKELIEERTEHETLEIEVAAMKTALAQMNEAIESLKRNLDSVTNQRDDLDEKVLLLTKELELARALAEENEAIVAEAEEIAEFHKVQLDEKEEHVKLLDTSIHELEYTINVLEQQVDIVKGEAERQRLQREELELELHAVKEQMQNVRNNDSDTKRCLEEKEKNLHEALQRVQLLETEITASDAEISQCKAHISELNLHAEAQASEYKQKFKALEAMVEKVKAEVPATQSNNSSSSSSSSSNKMERNPSKPRGSGSPFKCIGLGLVQQIKSENEEELSAGRKRIEELEALAASRQKEIFMLNSRLAATESMTHDVIRDLLGVKLNINNYATLMDNQQLQSLMEEAQNNNVQTQVKEKEVANLKLQINEFIKERNGWLEEIERKQAEVMAAHVASEKLRQEVQVLTAANEILKMDKASLKKRVMGLEEEVKKLSGQQNIQQRIHHHAKIKEENNSLRSQNEDLSFKLQKTEAVLSRVKEELSKFRAANGIHTEIDFDEEQRLGQKLKEKEEERLQLAQKLLALCTTVLKAAGIARPASEISISAAEEALHQLKNRLVSQDMELQDVKLKNRILDERVKLCELRPQTSIASPRMGNENCQGQNRIAHSPFLSAFDR